MNSDAPVVTTDVMAGWMTVICQLVAENRRLKDHITSMHHIPLRYRDRPPGFVEARKAFCITPDHCFEFGDSAPVCGPCDTATVKALLSQE